MSTTLILGGGGMIGQKLAASLAGTDTQLTLFDRAFPSATTGTATQITGDIRDGEAMAALLQQRPEVIYHLASIVSGQAEADFDLGWDINVMAFWTFLEALRHEHQASGGSYCPRVIFTSSIAAFGGPYPDVIDDDFLTAPQTSYGAQKVTCEAMLTDVSRKGYADGLSLRLPTICVRPGKPNKAASGFFSGIIREPLSGQEAVLPVPESVRNWYASPRAAVGFLRHAAQVDTAQLEGRRALNLPGVSCSVGEQIEALREIAGEQAVALIRPEPDPDILAIVSGWPPRFNPARALALGFTAEPDFATIIRTYIEDDLPHATP